MAIGLGAALIGSAVIGAGASAIGASKNASAINQSTQAQLQMNQQNLEMQKDIFNQNKATLSPFVNTGTQATGAINALLGLTPTSQPAPATPTTPATTPATGTTPRPFFSGGFADGVRYIMDKRDGKLAPTATAAPATTPTTPAPTYMTPQQAFDNYKNSTGYQFRYNEGMNALNSGYAGAGTIKSGAAMRAATEYGQGIASQEFNNYLNLLSGQQGVGLTAAGAQAGVATNYANNAGAINAQSANAISQGAIAKANNTNDMLGGITSAVGLGLGLATKR